MAVLSRHGPRVAVSLLPLVLVILHVFGVVPLGVLQRLDNLIYDARLRWTMPSTMDERVVIVDVDERSLAELGQWPWPRDRMADLVDRLFDQQQAGLVGFDTVFAEPDNSTGLQALEQMASQDTWAQQAGLAQQIERWRPALDHDARFAESIRGRPVVLGYYFGNDVSGRSTGQLPPPVLRQADLQGRSIRSTQWDTHGANLPALTAAARSSGFFNALPDGDGIVRSQPLLAEFGGDLYESLALAMFRQWRGWTRVEPGFVDGPLIGRDYGALKSVVLRNATSTLDIPVDERIAVPVPFRGAGGPQGGSFHYVSAADVLANRLQPGSLKGRLVLVGTTAPGLLDLRVTPVGEAYPGVETHANLLVAMLDQRWITRPDYAAGYELLMLVLVGFMLAFGLPQLGASQAMGLSAILLGALLGLDAWLFLAHGLAMPMASVLVMGGLTFLLNMSYGYFIESRAKRELAQLFGTYVPPELVDEMVKDPDSYGMEASTRELTVMFCDMRGFTAISETLPPTELQALLNAVFSRLTRVIRAHRGTIDKYMGDCVMAFWGAPVDAPGHASLAVQAALDMAREVDAINQERASAGLSGIQVGIGLNTGDMCVGDMGSDVRRSYTVVGDAVNLASRLEGLSRQYGVAIVASEATRRQAPGFVWQELDLVRVKGKVQAVAIHTPLQTGERPPGPLIEELQAWQKTLKAWRTRDWDACDAHLEELRQRNEKKVLYRLYAERVGSMRRSPPPADWDGSTTFESK